MTKIRNTSYSFAETKYLRVAVREHILAPPEVQIKMFTSRAWAAKSTLLIM